MWRNFHKPWRSCILVWITYAAGGIFLLENPQNSLIALHPRWIWMLQRLKEYDVLVPGQKRKLIICQSSLYSWFFLGLYAISGWPIFSLAVWTTEIYKVAFWMRKYGSLSWKRTWVWANSSRIGALDKGPLTSEEKSTSRGTTSRYKDKSGKVKFKGNALLKQSQKLWL